MAALTMWDILAGKKPALNVREEPIYVPTPPPAYEAYSPRPSSRPAYRPAAESTKTTAQLQQEERDRKQAAVAKANEPRPTEDFITNMYYGGTPVENRRVITPAELKTGYVNSSGDYVPGRATSFGDVGGNTGPAAGGEPTEADYIRYRNLSQQWYNKGMDVFDQPY